MDLLTSAANAILRSPSSAKTKNDPSTKGPILRDLTNLTPVKEDAFSRSFNSLLTGKITAKLKLRTPRKRKRSSFYSDENVDPLAKTPKNLQNVTNPKQNSPVTPMSNLKLLTRIASMEEPLSSRKTLFRTVNEPPKIQKPKKCDLRRVVSENLNPNGTKLERPKLKKHPTSIDIGDNKTAAIDSFKVAPVEISRKEKSLGYLCDRFFEEFPLEISFLETPRKLVIDDVAQYLNTERRRVYDIINILESLNMATRAQKNTYQWTGTQHLENTLGQLKSLAMKWGISIHLNVPIEQNMKEFHEKESAEDLIDKVDQRRDRSLGVLCQKFLMLFLNSPPPHMIQLDVAIYLLLGREGEDIDKSRFRGRRIYDIANVLSSLKLIQKVQQSKCYQYIGPEVHATEINEFQAANSRKCRHSLLPPLLSQLSHSTGHLHSDLDVTPYEGPQPELKKGRRPRKLVTEFAGKINRSASEDRSSDAQNKNHNFSRHPSLNDICQVASIERSRILLEDEKKYSNPAKDVLCYGKPPIQTIGFQQCSSPRIALTFQQPREVVADTPKRANILILKKISSSNNIRIDGVSPRTPLASRPIIVFKSSHQQLSFKPATPSNEQDPHTRVQAAGEGSEMRPNLPCVSSIRVNQNLSNISVKRENLDFKPLPFRENLDFKPLPFLPNVSLNTLSRQYYKTVFGSMPQANLRTTNTTEEKSSYRFIIKSGAPLNRTPSSPRDDSGKTFVKMPFPSPDSSSSAESELESIFGDSFKFSKPKSLS